MSSVPYIALGASALALLLALHFARVVLAAEQGTELMREIGAAIREGAMAFLRREYRWVSVFVAAMFVLLLIVPVEGRPAASFAFLMGAVLSSLAGFIGMRIATAANTRTAHAARSGASVALPLAFKGGAVMGFSVAGLALLGISFNYLLWVTWVGIDDAFSVVAAFGLGASSIALFARIGGGIYTKAADVGGDLVGKVEAGIPEDDPRNPATIADSVGDNVGDVAGMGADLFESYAGSIVAPIVLTTLLPPLIERGIRYVDANGALGDFGNGEALLLYPILIGAVGMIASIIGALATRGREGASLSTQLHTGQYIAMALTVVGAFIATTVLFSGNDTITSPVYLTLTIVIGLIGGWAIGFTSEYFTSERFKPVRSIADQAETGPATVTIAGVAQGKLSTLPAVALVAAMIGLSYWFGQLAFADGMDAEVGLYGVALAAIGMLSVTGVIVAVDAYGPIADNAGGIAEMSDLPSDVRQVTDQLDALGNTTAAIAKGFAVGSAAVTALALFKSFSLAAGTDALETIDINNTAVTIGLFIGAMTPFVFAALTMSSVGRAAQAMIVEVRRQFADIPGLREGKAGVKPDSRRCVDISTQAALREMVLPGALAVVLPLVIGYINVRALGGFLAGAVVTGFLIAIYMANSGGAWDNAKKYIEAGAHGGKGTDAHAAAVVGDTIGDPFKDTSGPAMNILIKVMTIVSLVFVPVFV